MNAVLGYTQILADGLCGPVTTQQRDHLGRVSASGRHLLDLIAQLLSHARIEAGEETVEMSVVALTDVVEQSLLLVRPLADQKGISIHVDGPVQQVLLRTDPGKLRQILVNVLANAVKFSAQGDIVLRIEVLDAGEHVVFEVSDSGSGIATAYHERIFEPFWRSEYTSGRRQEGTGLGLSVARQLARLLGGDLRLAASAPGHGSTFVALLPVRLGM
jgi:signal transduction histidine kinase